MDENKHINTDLINFGYTITNSKNVGFDLHCHNYYEIFYFISGDINYLVEGKQYAPKPHSILMISPKVFHGVKIESDNDYKRYALHFLPNIVSFENRALLLSPFNCNDDQKDIYYQNVNDFRMQSFFDNLIECTDMSSDIQDISIKIRIEALLSQILFMSESTKGTYPKKYSSALITNIIDYLNENLTQSITLDDISNRFFISKHHLNKVFKKVIGTTLWEYIIYKRVTLAQQYLMQGETASSASINAGFHDYSSFYRAYKKIYGHSPAEHCSNVLSL